jgi:hypothetical protein
MSSEISRATWRGVEGRLVVRKTSRQLIRAGEPAPSVAIATVPEVAAAPVAQPGIAVVEPGPPRED